MSEVSVIVFAWIVMMIGIWHPTVVNVSPEVAAIVGTLLGIFASIIVSIA